MVASVGDRLDTDIAGGQRVGLKTILLMSGIATPESLATSPIKPTWMFPGIAELARALEG
jgi:4-nitrophenyl phosphatase